VFSRIASSSFETIVIIGPDHENIASFSLTTALAVWDTPFGPLKPQKEIIEFLTKSGLKIDNPAHLKEWSLRISFPYIKYVFPDATIVPILLQKTVLANEIDNLAELLASKLPPSTLFVLSADFVHKLTVEEAEKEDAKTINAIKSFNKAEIGNLNMDAPAGLRLFLDVMEKRGAKSANLARYSNVYEEQNQHPEFKPYPYLVTYMTWIFAK
jgi:AmmeMemoRadiSam system protein B